MSRILRTVLIPLTLVVLAGAGAPAPGAEGPACGRGTGVHLVGLDTASGKALLSVPGREEGSYLVAWTPGEGGARPVREAEGAGRFGGSVGPGPVFAFRRCGAECLQPLRRDGGSWRPLGEPLTVPAGTTAHGTYDRSGAAWVVVHAAGTERGTREAWAFRRTGPDWRPAGRLQVTAVGAPGALPAPWLEDGIVSGTGLFRAGAPPELWVDGLPSGAGEPGARLVPLGEAAAAVLVPAGRVFRTADRGATWRRTAWTPWTSGAAEPWTPGRDFTLDLATGAVGEALPVIWFDRRLPGRETLVYTEMSAAGRWREVARGPGRIPTSAGEDLFADSVLRTADGRWSTLFGCVRSAGSPRLVATTVVDGAVG
ncbi:MAG: hypothetical protein ACLF0P_09830, partial [Thermoanaerobaculia bacterium]